MDAFLKIWKLQQAVTWNVFESATLLFRAEASHKNSIKRESEISDAT
jgi:hypothetical protein